SLNELYLALSESHRPAQAPFAWIAANATELPWQELNHRTGRIEERRLAPDAIVELPAERIRVFLEDETGTHPLPRRDERARPWAQRRSSPRWPRRDSGRPRPCRRSVVPSRRALLG